MTSDSKIFVGLRPTRKKPAEHRESGGPRCQWDGCDKQGMHRAPVGADAEGLYLLFCNGHAKEYSEGYNYVAKLSSPVTACYQREAASGSRPSWGVRVDHSSDTPLPSSIRSGTAKTTSARKNAARSQAAKAPFNTANLKCWKQKRLKRSISHRTRRPMKSGDVTSRSSRFTIPMQTMETAHQRRRFGRRRSTLIES